MTSNDIPTKPIKVDRFATLRWYAEQVINAADAYECWPAIQQMKRYLEEVDVVNAAEGTDFVGYLNTEEGRKRFPHGRFPELQKRDEERGNV